MTPLPLSSSRRQRGVALLIALLILVVVSLMGITAMKTSMFSAKIATGTQVDAMAFEGAESAISDAYRHLETMSSDDLQFFLGGGIMRRCLSGGTSTDSACTASSRMDSRGLVNAGSRIRQEGFQAVSGGQVSMSGNSVIPMDFNFDIVGESEVETFNIDNAHVQQALKRGLVSNSDLMSSALQGSEQ
jgi:Tfp pilus assembly protein PilX